MAEIPQYQQRVAMTAPEPIKVPMPYTAGWDRLAQSYYQQAESALAEGTRVLGAAAQQEAGPDNPVASGALGAAMGLFNGSKSFREGADQVLAAQKTVQLETDNAALMEQYKLDPNGYAQAFEKYTKEKFLPGTPGHVVPQFISMAAQKQAASARSITLNVGRRDRAERVAAGQKTIDQLSNDLGDGILNGSLTPEQIADKQAQSLAILQGLERTGDIDSLESAKFQDNLRKTILTSEIRKRFRESPSQDFIDRFGNAKDDTAQGETFGLRLRPEERDRLKDELQRDWNHMESVRRVKATEEAVAMRTKIDDDLALERTKGYGSMSDDDYRVALGRNPAALEEALNKKRLAREEFTTTKGLALTSPGEDAAILVGRIPQEGPGYKDNVESYERTKKAIEAKREKIAKDPGQYVLENAPGVAGAVTSPDAVYRKIGHDTMVETQRNLGVPESQIKLMSNDRARKEAGDISGMFPEEAANRLQQIFLEYGEHYPKVIQQLAVGVEGRDKLTPEYAVLGTLNGIGDEKTRVDLARALSMKEEEAVKLIKAKDSGAITDINQGVARQLENFQSSAMAQGDLKVYDQMYDLTRRLAMHYVVGGMNTKEAISKATSAIDGKYSYIRLSRGTNNVRVPKDIAPQAEFTMERTMDTLRSADLEPLPPRRGELFNEIERQDQQIRDIRRSGNWVTNERDDGAVLLYSNGQPVMRKVVMPGGEIEYHRVEVFWKYAKTTTPAEIRKWRQDIGDQRWQDSQSVVTTGDKTSESWSQTWKRSIDNLSNDKPKQPPATPAPVPPPGLGDLP